MFGNNNKISSYQLNRLLMLNLFSVTSLILPMAVVRICGITGVAAIGAGAILTGLFVLFLNGVMNGFHGSYPEFCKHVLGTPMGNVIACIYGVKYFVAAAFLLAVFAQVVNHTFLTDIPQWLLGAALLIVCTYAVSKGMETRARLGQLLVWVVIVPFIVILLLALPKVHLEWIWDTNTMFGSLDGFLWASVLSLACFFSVEWIWFHKQKITYGSVAKGIVWAAVLNIAIILICVGVFSVEGMNGEAWPVVTLMQVVRWPGGFLSRQDGLILAFWMIGMFMAISGCYHYGCESFKGVYPLFNRPWKKWFPAVGIFILFSLISTEDATRCFLRYMLFVYLPLSVGIPLLLYVVKKLGAGKCKKVSALCLILLTSMFLGGCMSHVEMEDRNFVMCLGVDLDAKGLCVSMGFPDLKALTGNGDNIHYDAITLKGKDLNSIIDSYHGQNNKRLDFGQIQMIVFGNDLLKNQGQMENVLAYIKDHQEFTRTILVCAAKENARTIVALDDDVNGSIGIYLRQMFENNHGGYVTTVGDLIISLSNDDVIWDMAVVDEGQGGPVITDIKKVTYYLNEE